MQYNRSFDNQIESFSKKYSPQYLQYFNPPQTKHNICPHGRTIHAIGISLHPAQRENSSSRSSEQSRSAMSSSSLLVSGTFSLFSLSSFGRILTSMRLNEDSVEWEILVKNSSIVSLFSLYKSSAPLICRSVASEVFDRRFRVGSPVSS